MKILIGAVLAVLFITGLVQWRATSREAAAAAAFPPVGQVVDVDGVKVHAQVMGNGPDLVMIHGASGNLRDFTFDHSASQEAVYAPGDHLGLFPANRASDVVFLKHRMVDCPPSMDKPLLLLETTTGKHWKEVEDFPKFLLYEDLLSNVVDLRLPSQEVLKMGLMSSFFG